MIITELAANASYGDLLTFQRMATALDLDPDDERDQVRQAVSAARPLLLRDHKRALVAERGRGYRVAHPREQSGIAQVHRRKADRQINNAIAMVTYVDESKLTPEELKRNEAIRMVLTNLHTRLNGAESRLEQLERAVFGNAPKVISGEVEP